MITNELLNKQILENDKITCDIYILCFKNNISINNNINILCKSTFDKNDMVIIRKQYCLLKCCNNILKNNNLKEKLVKVHSSFINKIYHCDLMDNNIIIIMMPELRKDYCNLYISFFEKKEDINKILNLNLPFPTHYSKINYINSIYDYIGTDLWLKTQGFSLNKYFKTDMNITIYNKNISNYFKNYDDATNKKNIVKTIIDRNLSELYPSIMISPLYSSLIIKHIDKFKNHIDKYFSYTWLNLYISELLKLNTCLLNYNDILLLPNKRELYFSVMLNKEYYYYNISNNYKFCSLNTFHEKLNHYLTNDKTINLFNNVDFSNVAISGSCMSWLLNNNNNKLGNINILIKENDSDKFMKKFYEIKESIETKINKEIKYIIDDIIVIKISKLYYDLNNLTEDTMKNFVYNNIYLTNNKNILPLNKIKVKVAQSIKSDFILTNNVKINLIGLNITLKQINKSFFKTVSNYSMPCKRAYYTIQDNNPVIYALPSYVSAIKTGVCIDIKKEKNILHTIQKYEKYGFGTVFNKTIFDCLNNDDKYINKPYNNPIINDNGTIKLLKFEL